MQFLHAYSSAAGCGGGVWGAAAVELLPGAAIRLPDYFWKLALIFFVLAASVVVMKYKWPPKLGIDLSGGLMMVYEVDQGRRRTRTRRSTWRS